VNIVRGAMHFIGVWCILQEFGTMCKGVGYSVGQEIRGRGW
jgi:hypothetical protein